MKKLIKEIVNESIKECLPDKAVSRELKKLPNLSGKKILIAIGKASYQMAKTALESEVKFDETVVITKYNHLKDNLRGCVCFEAGHPISDENTIKASKYAYNLVGNLTKDDLVVMLISGGGSSLFEIPLLDFEEIKDINNQLLKKGADIVEINTIRKRLSKVKGGKFAKHCYPAQVYNIILSDVIGNRPDMIASGPSYEDFSICEDALKIVKKYKLNLSKKTLELLKEETVKTLPNVTTKISGSVDQLCFKAKEVLEKNGCNTEILTTCMDCEASEAGFFLSSIAKTKSKSKNKLAYIFGGETIVHLKGKGKGGRNQELVFASAKNISGLKNVTIISFSSDGTDGPTDAAGAFVDGETFNKLKEKNIDYDCILKNNDSYTVLKQLNQLIITEPTGTNVNDASIILIN